MSQKFNLVHTEDAFVMADDEAVFLQAVEDSAEVLKVFGFR